MRNSRGVGFGIVLIAIGILLLLDNMYYVDFWRVVHTYWPFVLIILGLSIVLRRSSSPATPGWTAPAPSGLPGSEADLLFTSTTFGNFSTSVRSQAFKGGNVSTTFGDTDIDMLGARLAEGDHLLTIDGVFGDTRLRLPKDMAVRIHVSTTFGDVSVNEQRREGISSSIDFESPGFQTATRRLRVAATRVFGDVTIST